MALEDMRKASECGSGAPLRAELERLTKLKASAEALELRKEQQKRNEQTAEVQRLQGHGLEAKGRAAGDYLAESDFSHWALSRVKEAVPRLGA